MRGQYGGWVAGRKEKARSITSPSLYRLLSLSQQAAVMAVMLPIPGNILLGFFIDDDIMSERITYGARIHV